VMCVVNCGATIWVTTGSYIRPATLSVVIAGRINHRSYAGPTPISQPKRPHCVYQVGECRRCSRVTLLCISKLVGSTSAPDRKVAPTHTNPKLGRRCSVSKLSNFSSGGQDSKFLNSKKTTMPEGEMLMLYFSANCGSDIFARYDLEIP